eukprot:TRINITY_DN665_c0_g1_i3.p1 TRINITY_DN665_c0_g1~~TRINITY_DN665_c0_g1_i3.p1  ORF type:complete len:126 (-),score=25.51 TRINITY_DN665_c0_g1_i3:43-420(-)
MMNKVIPVLLHYGEEKHGNLSEATSLTFFVGEPFTVLSSVLCSNFLQKLAPTWDAYSTSAPEGVNVAHIDCTVHKAVCSAQGIRGYPTLKAFASGAETKYQGQRSVEGFNNFWTELLSGSKSSEL